MVYSPSGKIRKATTSKISGATLLTSAKNDGSSNSTASEPEENALNVEDGATTIYSCIGITADKELMAPGDRPIEIVKGGKIRKELLA